MLNFLAGLFAGAGINMLTSAATGPVGTSTVAVAVDAGIWVLAAGASTWLAHVVEVVNREVERRLQDDFSPAEEAGVRRSVRGGMAVRLRAATVATVLAATLGVLFLPHFVPMPW